jgi:hypothetical protein
VQPRRTFARVEAARIHPVMFVVCALVLIEQLRSRNVLRCDIVPLPVDD